MLKQWVALIVLVGFAFGLAACNTVAGVGKDVKAGGEKLERSAEKAKKE